MGEEAHGVAFLLGGIVYQSPLLQGLVDTGGIKAFQRVTGLVLLEYLAEEGTLTLFLVSRDIIAIGIDVTKQGNTCLLYTSTSPRDRTRKVSDPYLRFI